MTDIARPRAKRPPQRLVAGLLWLVAAALGIASTFPVAFTRLLGDGYAVETGSWLTRTTGGSNGPVESSTVFGIPVVLAAVILVLAALVALLSARRVAALVAGAFGAGLLVDSVLGWYMGIITPDQDSIQSHIEVGAGLLLATAAAVLALAGLALVLFERTRPNFAPAPYYPPAHQPVNPPTHPPMRPVPPPMPQQAHQQPRSEPETPSYGVPVQQAPAEPPQVPEPGTISRKLDGGGGQ